MEEPVLLQAKGYEASLLAFEDKANVLGERSPYESEYSVDAEGTHFDFRPDHIQKRTVNAAHALAVQGDVQTWVVSRRTGLQVIEQRVRILGRSVIQKVVIGHQQRNPVVPGIAG